MNYRDERDALRGRIEGLEEDLEDAKRLQQDDAAKRERMQQIEARMRETEDNLRAMRAELAALGAKPQPKKNRVPLVMGISIAFLSTAVAGFLLVAVRASPPPPMPQDFQNAPAVPAAEPAPLPEIATVDPVKPAVPARQTKAQWIGKITRVQGLAGAPGSSCIIDATLEYANEKQRVAELSVKCNDRVVYHSTDKLEGMSMSSAGFGEENGKEAGSFAYAISYNDTGARSGPRTQISLDTTQGQGVVWNEVIPIFRVEFSVPTMSTPVKGDALLPPKK